MVATVTGTVATFGWGVPLNVQIIFTPSGNATTGDLTSPAIFATAPIVVTPDAQGVFSVNLQPTDAVTPAIWYTISLRWLNPDGGYIYHDFPDWKLFIPAEGGRLSDLLETPWNPTLGWVGSQPPAGTATPNTLWLNDTTGELSIWSN